MSSGLCQRATGLSVQRRAVGGMVRKLTSGEDPSVADTHVDRRRRYLGEFLRQLISHLQQRSAYQQAFGVRNVCRHVCLPVGQADSARRPPYFPANPLPAQRAHTAYNLLWTRAPNASSMMSPSSKPMSTTVRRRRVPARQRPQAGRRSRRG